jgi:hypothetical protein
MGPAQVRRRAIAVPPRCDIRPASRNRLRSVDFPPLLLFRRTPVSLLDSPLATRHSPLPAAFPPTSPSLLLATGHYSLAPRPTPHVTGRPTSGGRSCADPPPLATFCSTDPELTKTERGPTWPTKPSLYFSPTRRFRRTNHPIPRNSFSATRHAPLPACRPFPCDRESRRKRRSVCLRPLSCDRNALPFPRGTDRSNEISAPRPSRFVNRSIGSREGCLI